MLILTLNSISIGQTQDYYGTVAVSLIDAPTKFYTVSFTNKLEKVFSESGFDVVERNSINKIMKEWKLKTSGVTDDEFEGIGEILAADYLITGTVDDDGKNSGIYCVIKMIDVQTGKLMDAASIEGQITTKRELYDIGLESIIEQLIYGTNQKIPFDDNMFDALVSWDVLHYEGNDANYHLALKEYQRVLKPGGRLFLSTVAPKSSVLRNAKI